MKHILSCMALLIGLAASAFSAHAAITMNTSVQYKIKNAASGLVLGIDTASQAAGAKVVQWADNGTADHLWHFMPMGNGQYNIENMLTHQVLGVANGSTADGGQIVQWSDNGTADHLWTVTQAASGNFLIQNVNSGKYLEVFQASNLNTATIDQWGLTGCTCQEWQLVNTQVSPYPAPRTVAGEGRFVHDPYLLRDSSGKYWLYGSHQTLSTSTDLTTFTPYTNCTTAQKGGYATCPSIGPDFPSWSGLQTPKGWNNGANTDVWAPSLMVANGTYYQYYSIPYQPTSWPAAVIGVATSSAPQGPWTDKGIVARSWSTSAAPPPPGFKKTTDNAIDPAPFIDASGKWWMAFGSWSDGLHLMQLNPATGLQSTTNTTVYKIAQRGSPTSAVEGPFIYYYKGYYYYFAPINVCCSANSPYRTVVGRSASVTGPYVDRGGVALTAGGGTILVSTHGNIVGPGGGSVFNDAGNNNRPTFVYHYYDGNNNGRPTLGINPLGFTADGWPFLMAN
ncbi:MAG TPA: family 43 glycosylhydrolase [Duganella sp.]